MPGFLNTSNPAAYCNIGSVAIFYTSKYCAGTPNQNIPNGYLSTYQLQNTSGNLTETIKTTCLSYWNPAAPATPTNQTTLDTLTQQFATDYTNWKKVTFDYVFVGIAAVVPNALVDVMEFDYLSVKKGNFTRIYSYPINWTVQILAHYDYSNDCPNSTDTGQPNWDQQPYLALYGPPGMCSGNSLQLTRYGLIFADGRLSEKYLSTDTL
jgi:hypothetical protein